MTPDRGSGQPLAIALNSIMHKPRQGHAVASHTSSTWPRGPMDKASAYGAGDCRFESCRGHSCMLVSGQQCMAGRAHAQLRPATPMQQSLKGTWCSGITSAPHAEGPGFKSQCVHLLHMSKSKSGNSFRMASQKPPAPRPGMCPPHPASTSQWHLQSCFTQKKHVAPWPNG